MNTAPLDNDGHTTVVIVNYKGFDDTVECLYSIRRHCDVRDVSVVLIDNESSEPTGRFDEAAQSLNLTVLQSPINIGFTGACNLGMQIALDKGSGFVFLLNNDTVLVDDVISQLRARLSRDNALGILGAANYYYSSPDRLWCAGIKVGKVSGRNWSLSKFSTDADDVILVDYVPGSSLMIKTEVLREIGLFDDNFFAYLEDTDLCERAIRRQYKVGFLSSSRILHKIGRSSTTPLKEYLRTRNRLYFLRKHLSFGKFLLASVMVGSRVGIKSLLAAVRLDTAVPMSHYAGIVDFYRRKMGPPRNRMAHRQ